jgi:carboxyl-terminal processing protease
MSRNHCLCLTLVVLVSSLCYYRAGSPQSRHLAEIMRRIDRNYLEPVDRQDLFEGAVEGMIGRLDDNSAFIDRDHSQQFREMLQQEFVGIGIEPAIDAQRKVLMVRSPLPGSPAFRAGLRGGDRVLQIDGQSTAGLDLNRAIELLRGERGAAVTLLVERDSRPQPFAVRLVRDTIQVDAVLGDTRHPDGTWSYHLQGVPGLGYVRVVSFGEHTVEQFRRALEGLSPGQLRGLILDLRHNPGGVLEAATGVCEQFLRAGVSIVTTRGRGGRINETWVARHPQPLLDLPLVVLINRHSASASEIVAACLQDYGRAKVIGERSYGKGTVQRPIWVEWGKSQLKLTTASYWRPSNKNIHRGAQSLATDDWGVRPDPGFEVLLTDDLLEDWVQWRQDRDANSASGQAPLPPAAESDAVLKRAIEHLQTLPPAAARAQ